MWKTAVDRGERCSSTPHLPGSDPAQTSNLLVGVLLSIPECKIFGPAGQKLIILAAPLFRWRCGVERCRSERGPDWGGFDPSPPLVEPCPSFASDKFSGPFPMGSPHAILSFEGLGLAEYVWGPGFPLGLPLPPSSSPQYVCSTCSREQS